MFENRSEKQLIVIYAIIAILIALGFSLYNMSSFSYFPKDPVLIVIVANIIFFCIFYILYLPLKVKRSKEK